MRKNVDDVIDDIIFYENPKKFSYFKTHFIVKEKCKKLETFPKYLFY